MEDQERVLFIGPCRGGPMDGQEAVSRFPKGFLLVDKVSDSAWIYEWVVEEEHFVVRNEEPMLLDYDKRMRAAEEFSYDVVAMP